MSGQAARATSPAERKRRARLKLASRRILAAQRPIRILKAITWPESVKRRFFAARGRELPRPVYAPLPFDPADKLVELEAVVRGLDSGDPLERLLIANARSYGDCVRLLTAVGSRDFYRRSCELYGKPADCFDRRLSHLDLALHLDRVLAGFTEEELGPTERPLLADRRAASFLERRLRRGFGGLTPPRVVLATTLTADAAAGATTIKIKRGRFFNLATVRRLEQHEGWVHAATTANGLAQPLVACLGKGPPRTIPTQEGLAVFAELASGTMDVPRLRTLKDRVIATRMAEDGADFLDLYRFFRDRCQEPSTAFDNSARVMRGGKVEGGAPFTKDVVYLDGLVRVHHWVQVAVKAGRPELFRSLWLGKVAIEDIPVLIEEERRGLVAPPRLLPPWARDLRQVAAWMSFGLFLERLDRPYLDRSRAPLLRTGKARK